jgi:hypothetical protein
MQKGLDAGMQNLAKKNKSKFKNKTICWSFRIFKRYG